MTHVFYHAQQSKICLQRGTRLHGENQNIWKTGIGVECIERSKKGLHTVVDGEQSFIKNTVWALLAFPVLLFSLYSAILSVRNIFFPNLSWSMLQQIVLLSFPHFLSSSFNLTFFGFFSGLVKIVAYFWKSRSYRRPRDNPPGCPVPWCNEESEERRKTFYFSFYYKSS